MTEMEQLILSQTLEENLTEKLIPEAVLQDGRILQVEMR